MTKKTDICYSGDQTLDLYLPEQDDFAVFVYFHGGGLEGGDKGVAVKIAEYLQEHGVAVVSANYRLYPEASYPEFIHDAAAAVAWTFERYGESSKIYVGGSSAGAYLSMMLCFDEGYLAPYGIEPCRISGFIHDAGQPTVHYNVLRERGADTRRVIVDEAAPLYHVGRAERYAPMLLIVADEDIPGRYEQMHLLLKTLQAFQQEAKLMVMKGAHCCYTEEKLGEIAWKYIQG